MRIKQSASEIKNRNVIRVYHIGWTKMKNVVKSQGKWEYVLTTYTSIIQGVL